MSDAIIAEAQRRIRAGGKAVRMKLNCVDVLALAGVEIAAPAPAPEPETEIVDPTATDGTIDRTEDDGGVADEGGSVSPYAEWKKDDLVSECENRNLAKSGTKDELIARIDAHDQSGPDPEE